ncbi:nucleotidyl transferase AbiEii/AbiGii toxin family protein [Rhizobium leguminosarum bv. viciae]|uniref:nucleotidyl transferase AbiEii/AbiGii toxin family protein n=1 Tax=Rhizobium leguminosarum TaxID=384 RepID=UPI001038BDDB|nr:nucleotidyl transferase AbiEii/AbiGii toxin family protein [Rhizobium leguminosarum]TCA47794.1 nucleotidyl transferase AbiEii/AbiGii toxin family protein [Rhizobium leguminosarum bv. viciae]
MAREQYIFQLELLVQALPMIADEPVFALKGGTAINLFYRDLPRLSVDIDLTYLPLKPRVASLAEIDEALDRVAGKVESIKGVQTKRIAGGGGGDTRVEVRRGQTAIKIETSPVARGTVHPVERRRVSERVEDQFGFAEMQVVAFEDLFGGKMHAAVDRQHPRDLFDIKLLYENEGLTDPLFRTFLVYVASSGRPPHELLQPNRADVAHVFNQEFDGMTIEKVSLDELLDVRERFLKDIQERLDDKARTFLLSLHDGDPDFEVIGLPHALALPAVRWKILNLQKLRNDNPPKHAEQRGEIERLFIR